MVYRVDIYVEADSTTPRQSVRAAGYVLECIKGDAVHTREEFAHKTGTYNAVILQMLVKALKRINQSCEVHIHTQDTYVLNMIDKNLELWAGNGFHTVKGELVKNHFEWEQVWKLGSRHLLVAEPGEHSYFTWMQGEMAALGKPAASSIS